MAKSERREPSSLVHYTSLQGFSSMIIDSLNGNSPFLQIHFSNILMMNDPNEYLWFMDKFLTGSKSKNKLESHIKDILANDGNIFVFSLMRSDSLKQGKIPMWKLYADNCKGIKIKFDYKQLKEHFNSQSILLKKCEYLKDETIREKIKKFNNIFRSIQKNENNTNLDTTLNEMLNSIAFLKNHYWEYEDEYRVVIRSNKNEYKLTTTGLVEYYQYKIPLKFLNEIQIGPNANKFVINKSLTKIKDSLIKKYTNKEINFKITESKILIK